MESRSGRTRVAAGLGLLAVAFTGFASRAQADPSPSPSATPHASPVATAAPSAAPIVDRGLPPLPDLSGVEKAVNEQLTALAKAAAEKPDDAARVGRLAALYQAYGFVEAADATYCHLRALQPDEFRGVYLHAHVQLALRNFSAAASSFRRAAELKPDYVPASIGLVSALARARDFRAAIDVMVPLVDKYPNDPVINYRLGLLYLEVGEPVWAVELLKPTLRQNPDWGGVRSALALAFRRLNQPERAEALHASSNTDVPTMHDPELMSIFAETTGATAEERRGLAFLTQANYPAALEHFEKALAFNPDSATARAGRIDALVNSGELERAETQLKADLAARPDDPTTLLTLTDLYLLRKQFGDADATLAKVRKLTVDPQMIAALDVRLALGRQEFAKARDILEPLTKSDTENATAWQQLGEAYLGLKQLDQAEAALKRALELGPQYGEAMDALGDVYAAKNESGAALTWYRKAGAAGAVLSEDKCTRVVSSTLSMADYETGVRVLLDCTAAYPRNEDIADTLLRVRAMCPDPKYRDAKEAMRLARQLYGDDPATMSVRGLSSMAAAFAEADNWRQAQEYTRAAIAKATAEKDATSLDRQAKVLAAYLAEKHTYDDN